MTKQYADIGSVSSGTMRPEDLIPAFLDVLEELDGERCAAIRQEFAEELIALGTDEITDEQQESLDYLLNESLFDALNEYAPPYCYFGAHPGDGADYGFWPVEDLQQAVKDDDGLVVNDLEDVPEDHIGYVLHVNDHGNATLMERPEGSAVWSEIWSIV